MNRNKALSSQSIETETARLVDVNVSRPAIKAAFKLYDIKMRENALTIAIWFKTDEKSGKLFSKEGYTAFGKGYKTVSCEINNGTLRAGPTKLSGGKVATGQWQFVVLSINENESGLYLNGEQVAKGIGSKDIATDALDFFVGHPAIIDNFQLFDRLLQPEEVKRLYDSGKQ